MERLTQEQIIQQQQQPPLKCPRCDSSNTKFCYYNNYSLSQPRHFCKACKRYWTRGGTLRKVPVGGGCRKNKRVKKVTTTAASDQSNSPSLSAPVVSTTSTNPSAGLVRIDRVNPLVYGLHSNNTSSDLNLSFQRFDSMADTASVYEYNLQQNLLGFSSSSLMANDITTSKPFLSNYVPSPLYASSNSSVSPSLITTSSLFNLEPEKSISHQNNFFGIIPNYSDMQMQGNNNKYGMEASNDPNSLFSVGTSWFDPANFGSSVPSLI